jgi:hypothetical protein
LERYNAFIGDYAKRLDQVFEVFDPSGEFDNDVTLKPVELTLAPEESTSVVDLFKSDNKALNKILTALVAICQEANFLKTEVGRRARSVPTGGIMLVA